MRALVDNVEKICIKTNQFCAQNCVFKSSCRLRSIQRKSTAARSEARTERERQDDHVHASAREFSRQAHRQNLKASTTAQHHVHAHPAVGITSTEPGRKARPCKPGGRARPREIFETKTQTITKTKSRHAYEPLTHALRSLRFRYASYRKFKLLEVLRAVPDARTSTET